VSIYEFDVPAQPPTIERGFSVVSGDYQMILWPAKGEALYTTNP